MTPQRPRTEAHQRSRVEADLVFEVDDGHGRAATGTVSTQAGPDAPGGRLVVDVDDPVALFAALPARLERSTLDAAGALLAPAPVVEVRAAGRRLAALDVTGSSVAGRLLAGDQRLQLTPRGALAAARGRAPGGAGGRALAAAVALVLLAVLLGGRRRSR